MPEKLELVELMSKSVRVIRECLDSENDQVRFSAARYVVDQVLGKPSQRVDDESNRLVAGTAAALAQTLRQVLSAPQEQPHFEVVEGTIHVLGEGNENQAAVQSSAAYEEFPE